MTDVNEMMCDHCDANMGELKDVVTSDTDETSFSFDEEADLEDIPPSLLSYFETSKSRAAMCEKLILEGPEDFTASHHTQDIMNFTIEPDKDTMNEKVIRDAENEENNTSTDSRLLPAPTETEALFTHNVSVCPNNEGDAGADEYMESEKLSAFEVSSLEISLDEEERKKSSEYEAEREKQRSEEMEREEQRRQIERDFQEELRKIMEAEKLHQKELELMEKRAQEKLDQELLLQQELISNLQRRVEEERRRMEEEARRKKEEERKIEEMKLKKEEERKREEERRREEERNKIELEKKKLEDAMRMMKEEEERKRKDEEEKRKREEERKRIEEVRKKMEEEKRLKKEEEEKERNRIHLEKKKLEDAMRMMKEEEERKKKEEAERKRTEEEARRKKEEDLRLKEEEEREKEEERKRAEEAKRKMEKEKRKMEEEMRLKKEEEEKERNRIHLEKKKLEDVMIKEEDERKKKEEAERKRTEEEARRKKEEERKIEEIRLKEEEEREKEEERKRAEEAKKKMEKEKRKMEEEMRLKEEEEEERKREEEEGRITKETEERKKLEKMGSKKEEEEADYRTKMAEKKMSEEKRKQDKRENGNQDGEIKVEDKKKMEEAKKREKMEENEMKKVSIKKEGEKRTMKEELRPTEEDETRRKEDERETKEEKQTEEASGQRDEEVYRKPEEEIRLNDVDTTKRQHERETKDKEEETEDVEAEKEQNRGEKEVRENRKDVMKITEEEIGLKEKEERKGRMVQKREKEVRANELQENIRNNIERIQHSLTSQLEDSTTWTSSSPGPSHGESTICPMSTETTPHQRDPDKNISQTSRDKTVDCENQAAKPSTVSVFLPVCLPEHTEQKRLSWMKDCTSWSKLSLQNRRKQKGSVVSRRGPRRVSEAGSLPPLCPDSLLQSTGCKSLQEVISVTLEDLPGCSLSTLAQCTRLRSLTLRRCGLKSLEGINQLPQLCYIDVQENDISFVDCENMTCLRVLQLGHNKLTSIHGLTGAENLDVLDVSHNSITRIAGLQSVRSLQRLIVDHNQLISTKGLRDVYTLLHLSCSHNHLANVEGLENSALLNTLDLRANSLTEPPSLNNQVLLRELHLDDNSISSLQALAACWLPLLQRLSVAQNRITQLPSMSDSVSLENLDLRFNCMSELQNVCKSLEGCLFLREIHLTGNPLQQERGWRSALQKAVPGLRAIDDQETDSSLLPPAVQRVSSASGSFLTFCQAQLQQTRDLQQQHSRELRDASSPLDAVNTSCRHFTEALQLAKDQRFAHEYGDTTVADKHEAAGRTTPEETLHMERTNAEEPPGRPEVESAGKVPPVIPNSDNIRCSYWTVKEESAVESHHDTFNTGKANAGSIHSMATKGKNASSGLETAPVSNHEDLDLQNTAAVVIQQLWRKYRQKCGNNSDRSTAEKQGGRGGDEGKPESGSYSINRSVAGQDYAATVIQAFWRGFSLRRRLASALAAVTSADAAEDDTFEEVDVDEFVFDEAELEKHWTLPLSDDSLPVSEQLLSLKPPGAFPELSPYILTTPPPVRRSKQAWVAEEPVDSAGQRVSSVNSNRSKSPTSASVLSGLTERSEKILEEWGFTHSHTALLMLKRAQKMKAKQTKQRDPSVRLAMFRNCSYQLDPVEAQNKKAQRSRNYIKVREGEPGVQQAERTERVKQERAQQWLQTQAAQSDRDSESGRFLPEISADVLSGGRVQLVADPGYTERLHHASGLWANSSLAAQPCRENNYPRRNSLGRARKEVHPSPKRVTSAPSKKERISFRDNPVQLSGGWGGGKKRDKVHK